ncbi:hypothetical protein ACIRQY_35345 [Streptomyces sp. NPDC101490]|uniref:hypothetical protein n=1 Tax=Streptomyces sp. NPDC101490 TaxID=3366143 RepID=UPI00382FE1C1
MPLALSTLVADVLDRAAFLTETPLHPPVRRPPGRGRRTPGWMEAERQFRPYPVHEFILPDPLARLAAVRRDLLAHRLGALDARQRTPRIVLYTHTMTAPVTSESFAATRVYADAQQWRTGWDSIVDCLDVPPRRRPGWRLALRLVRSGDLDGIVVPAYDAISHHLDEYEGELGLVEHVGGFLAMAVPETGGPR